MSRSIFLLLLFTVLIVCDNHAQPWNKEKANEWYARQKWIAGCNFIPSSAVNQLEMWQQETFDLATIDKELGWAESIGMNTMRVFLHHVAWQVDSAGFKQRINDYLTVADKHHIKTMFVFFDDCWNATYQPGKQPEPKPGVHNSGWLRDPGKLIYVQKAELYPLLERYVKDIITTFKNDERVLLWDLYNEPGNSANGSRSLPLLKKVFEWTRAVNPSQPLTAGVWIKLYPTLRSFQLKNSDIFSYHSYNSEKLHAALIRELKKKGRPLICTEYMARTLGSNFCNIMPLLKNENVGAINWGLADGKTNTKYAWATPIRSGSEPKLWFHEIFRKDGSPYNAEEIDCIKKQTLNATTIQK